MERLGFDVKSLYVCKPCSEANRGDAIRRPDRVRVLLNVFFKSFLKGWSLNECLFFSKAGKARLHECVESLGAGLVIADTLRVFELLPNSTYKFVDFDDLFSSRYTLYAKNNLSSQMFGYVEGDIPAWLRGSRLLTRLLFALEARLMRKREVAIAKEVAACSLVGQREAQVLSQTSGRQVHCLPMSVAKQPNAFRAGAGHGVVFLGKIDYAPNLDALNRFVREIVPTIRKWKSDFCVDVVGVCSASNQKKFSRQDVRFLGYVESLPNVLSRYAMMCAPVFVGSGLKTKILDAMACGLPIVGTELAFENIPVENGTHCLIAKSTCEFSEHIRKLAGSPVLQKKLSIKSYKLAHSLFGEKQVLNKWSNALKEAFEENIL